MNTNPIMYFGEVFDVNWILGFADFSIGVITLCNLMKFVWKVLENLLSVDQMSKIAMRWDRKMFPLYPKKYLTPTLNMFCRIHTKFCVNLFVVEIFLTFLCCFFSWLSTLWWSRNHQSKECSKCELPSKLNFSNDWLSLLQNHICVEFKPIYDGRPLPYLKNNLM